MWKLQFLFRGALKAPSSCRVKCVFLIHVQRNSENHKSMPIFFYLKLGLSHWGAETVKNPDSWVTIENVYL